MIIGTLIGFTGKRLEPYDTNTKSGETNYQHRATIAIIGQPITNHKATNYKHRATH